MTEFRLQVPVFGPLDTANPVSSRLTGTLIEARDVAHRWIGPRAGPKAFATPRTLADTTTRPGVLRNPLILDGDTGRITGPLQTAEQRDLGSKWTFDVSFLPATAQSATAATVSVAEWNHTAAATTVRLLLVLSGGGATGTLRAIFNTPAGAVSVTGTTVLTFADGLQHHVRVTREGTTGTIYLDGAQEVVNSSLGSSSPLAAGDDGGYWVIGATTPLSASELYAGRVYRMTMRSGVFSDAANDILELADPRAPNVRLHTAATTGHLSTFVADFSRFGAHGVPAGGVSQAGAATILGLPMRAPVQGMSHFTDLEGRSWNAVMVGGVLYWQRMS